MRVAFVYPNSRRGLIEAVHSGTAPDTALQGLNHLPKLGIDAVERESRLRRRPRSGGLVHRVTWNARELTLPWELRDVDLVCTSLVNLLPLAARVRRGPRVLLISYHLCSLHDRLRGPRRRLLAASVRSAAAVACSSESGRACLLERIELDESRVHTATLGVDAGWWAPMAQRDDGYVVSVGRDLARDYATFFEAVAGLPVRAVVAAKEENLRGLAVPDNVEIRLNVPLSEVRELYAGASVVVVPVQREGRGQGTENSGTIALLEAMASERPVVVSDRRFLRDYVEPERSGLTAPPEDPAALRAQIERVLSDPALGRALAVQARRDVEERHTTRRFAERLATIIRGLRA